MKKLLLSVSLVISVVNLFATIRTVCNFPSTIAQFSTIQAAVNASATGDTVYVHPSITGYNGFTLTDKRLVIMGPGMFPNIPQNQVAIING